MSSFASAAAKSALVVKKLEINEEGPHYVHIEARQAGVLAFLCSFIGIDSTTIFDVYGDRIEFVEGSLSGHLNTVMPLSSVSIATSGFVKPFLLLVFGVITLPFCIGIVLIIKYYLSKSLIVSVDSNGNSSVAICFKRSVIEGVDINEQTAAKIVDIIKNRALAQTAKV